MTEKTASSGWHPTDDGERWWDGQAWTNQFRDADGTVRTVAAESAPTKQPWGPGGYIAAGVIVSLVGALVFAVAAGNGEETLAVLGWGVSAVGAVVLLIGIIAQGVLVGTRSSKSD